METIHDTPVHNGCLRDGKTQETFLQTTPQNSRKNHGTHSWSQIREFCACNLNGLYI